MGGDAATLQQRIVDKMDALQAAEARACAIALLLEEEQDSATTLEVEVVAATL
jgi:hypothetical protein